MIYKKKNGGPWANFFKAFEWIKPEDFENLTKNPKHGKQSSLTNGTQLFSDNIL